MADENIDCRGMMCPMPIVQLTKAMKRMESGQVLEMMADDPGAKEDVPAWSHRTGNELFETKEEGDLIYFYIKKK